MTWEERLTAQSEESATDAHLVARLGTHILNPEPPPLNIDPEVCRDCCKWEPRSRVRYGWVQCCELTLDDRDEMGLVDDSDTDEEWELLDPRVRRNCRFGCAHHDDEVWMAA